MTNKQLAKILRDTSNSLFDRTYDPDYKLLLDEAADRLEGQGVWISVDERLPKVSGKYICGVKDKRENTWTVAADWSLEMKMWFGELGEIKNMVTHWMPLPEAPKMKGGAE